MSVNTAYDLNGHADNTTAIAHLLLERVDPKNEIKLSTQWPFPERLYLFVEPFDHVAYLTSRQIINTQTLSKFIHLAGRYPLDKRLLNHLDQCRLANPLCTTRIIGVIHPSPEKVSVGHCDQRT